VTETFRRAEELFRAQDFTGCVGLCRALLAERPDDIRALHLAGVGLVQEGRRAKGIELLRQALAAAPDQLILRMDCALALAGEDADAGIAILAEGARFHPGDPDLAARLARLLGEHGRHHEAQLVLRAALGARPRHLELRGLLAAELAADLDTAPALAQMRLMQAMLPGQSPLYANQGVLLQSLGELEDAIAAYRRAILIDPANHVAQVNLGTALMTKGDYESGFAHYEHRLFLPDMRLPPAALPRWQGEDLRGRRLLLSAEQGFGDLLQFVRFLPLLAERGGEVWLDCPPEMRRLLASLPGIGGIVCPGDQVPPMDFAAPLLSLPWILGSGGALMAETIPYVKAPWPGPRFTADPRVRIGLVWRGRPAKGELFIRRTLARRSCRLADLAALWRRDEFAWFSLQVDGKAEVAGTPVADLSPLIGDFADTAAIIAQLDLVISIDTATAHLAAAMGKPLWLLLAPGQCDYRWNGTTGGSPWYPAARLFRAGRDGFAALAAEAARNLDGLSSSIGR
jgi:Flp pilus assembly protein TadD